MMKKVARMAGTMFQTLGPEVIKIAAEREFKKAVKDICESFTPEIVEGLAQKQIPLQTVLKETGRTIDPPDTPNPGVVYLLSLPDSKIFELISEASPAHGRLLKKYPEYAKSIADTFRGLAIGE